MKILGMDGLDGEQLSMELQRGGRFVFFQYCISIVILTFKRSSNIYFIRAGESAAGKAAGFSLISALFGWWGIPWGPIYTVGTFITNARGGKDVTQEILVDLQQQASQ